MHNFTQNLKRDSNQSSFSGNLLLVGDWTWSICETKLKFLD